MLRAIVAGAKALLTAVFHAVWFVLKLVYRILKFFRIRLLALYVAVMAVLSLFLPVFGEKIVWFWVGFALCALATVLSWGYALRKKWNARPRPPREKEEEPQPERQPEPQKRQPEPPAPAYPLYFDVEGQPDYFFAEYEDRYELYYRGANGAEYIRTDLKRGNYDQDIRR